MFTFFQLRAKVVSRNPWELQNIYASSVLLQKKKVKKTAPRFRRTWQWKMEDGFPILRLRFPL